MHSHEAILGLLMRRGNFKRLLAEAMDRGAQQAIATGRVDMAFANTVRHLILPFEDHVRELLRLALQKLQERAGKGMYTMPDGTEFRASADLIDMDWGKSEITGDRITLRLVATHASMPRDPVIVDKVVQVQ